MTAPGRVVVLAVGNRWRSDDSVGAAVADALRDQVTGFDLIELDGETARLVDAWDGADVAVVVDAVRTGAPPGTVHRFEAGDLAAAPVLPPASSHGLGVQQAVALGRAVGRMPRRLVIVGVEAADFGHGVCLSPAVAAAVEPAARVVVELVGGRT